MLWAECCVLSAAGCSSLSLDRQGNGAEHPCLWAEGGGHDVGVYAFQDGGRPHIPMEALLHLNRPGRCPDR